jgi:hypothetical protein
VYGEKTRRSQTDECVQVEVLEQLLLDAGTDSIAEQRSIRTTTAARAGASRLSVAMQLAHDELKEIEAVSAVCRSSGKLP